MSVIDLLPATIHAALIVSKVWSALNADELTSKHAMTHRNRIGANRILLSWCFYLHILIKKIITQHLTHRGLVQRLSPVHTKPSPKQILTYCIGHLRIDCSEIVIKIQIFSEIKNINCELPAILFRSQCDNICVKIGSNDSMLHDGNKPWTYIHLSSKVFCAVLVGTISREFINLIQNLWPSDAYMR